MRAPRCSGLPVTASIAYLLWTAMIRGLFRRLSITLAIVLLVVDVTARLVQLGVQGATLPARQMAVGEELPLELADLPLLVHEPVRLAAGDLAGPQAVGDALVLLVLALIDLAALVALAAHIVAMRVAVVMDILDRPAVRVL